MYYYCELRNKWNFTIRFQQLIAGSSHQIIVRHRTPSECDAIHDMTLWMWSHSRYDPLNVIPFTIWPSECGPTNHMTLWMWSHSRYDPLNVIAFTIWTSECGHLQGISAPSFRTAPLWVVGWECSHPSNIEAVLNKRQSRDSSRKTK